MKKDRLLRDLLIAFFFLIIFFIPSWVTAQYQKPLNGTMPNRSHWAQKNCTGLWLFNEGIGNLAWDCSGNKNSGTIVGATWIAEKGTVLNFNGSTNYINCGNRVTISNNLTLMAWIRIPSKTLPSTHANIMHLGAAASYASLFTPGSARPFVSLNIGGTQRTLDSGYSLSINTWHQVAYVWNGDKIKIYVNSILMATSASFTGALNTSGTKYIGAYSGSGSWFQGRIAQVRFYDRALSSTEIALLYQNSFCDFEEE